MASVEVPRALGRLQPQQRLLAAVDALLRALDLRTIDLALLDVARRLEPTDLRSLDAIHLATALDLGADLDELVVYDRRLLSAGRMHGLNVVAPGA